MNISDRRRLMGPVNAKVPNIGISSDATNQPQQNLSKNANDEIRKIFLKRGLVDNANGSAYLEIGNTIIEVLVFGPRPIRGSFIERASFSVECKFLPYINQPNEVSSNGTQSNFNSNGRQGLTNVEQKISSFIETSLLPSIILEKYPKSTIDLFISVIATDGNVSLLNLMNWIVNCSSLALVDSGIELKDIVTSGHVRFNRSKDELATDSFNSSDDKDSIDCIISFMNLRNDEIVGLWFDGNQNELDDATIKKLINGCNEMSKKIRGNINSYLLNSIK